MSLISCVIITSLISSYSSHVTSLRHSSHVTQLMSLISFLDSMSLITTSLISCHSSHVTHLMSHHYVTDTKLLPIYPRVATFNLWTWPLPTSHRKIIPVTSAHPLRSNLCPPRSVPLPRRIGIGFQGVSHSSQSRSHVTYLMSHQYVTQPGLKG